MRQVVCWAVPGRRAPFRAVATVNAAFAVMPRVTERFRKFREKCHVAPL
jgi:hypothetical protein